MRRIESILGGRRSSKLGLDEERTEKRLVSGRSRDLRRRAAIRGERLREKECYRAGGGHGDSPHRACMCRKSAGKVNFPRKISILLVLSPVYNTGCKEVLILRTMLLVRSELSTLFSRLT
jgi:hypothetical protein